MKEKIKHYLKEIIIFTVAITLFANLLSLYKSQDLNKQQFNLQNNRLINGKVYIPNPNRPILLHIWGTWCPVCKAEADNIQRLSEYYDVITVAVNSGSDIEIAKYLKENGLNYRVINDKEGHIAQELHVAVYPTTFIYDKDKNLLFSEVGYTSSFGLFIRMWWASF